MASRCRAAYVPGVLRSSSPPGLSIKLIGWNTSRPNIRKLGVNPVWRLTVDLIAIHTVARCRSQSSCCPWIKQRSICKMVRFISFALGRYGVVLVLTIFSRSPTSLNIDSQSCDTDYCDTREGIQISQYTRTPRF